MNCLQCQPSNIFFPRNDWNIRSFNSKRRHDIRSIYLFKLSKIVEQKTGFNPLNCTEIRRREFVLSRQIMMVLMDTFIKKLSLRDIGKIFDKDHATVSHAKKTVQNLYETDPEFKKTFDEIKESVKQIPKKMW